MIISVSRRTDIPAFYSDWFFERIRKGYAEVKNPYNAKQIRRVSLRLDDVDCIVFWSKNPAPMLKKLYMLEGYTYYFLFTLTGYGREVERGIPSKKDVVIPAFLDLAKAIGPKRVIWRYDPIFLSPDYPLEYHLERYEMLARTLKGHTEKCIISFMDMYRNTEKNMRALRPEVWRDETMRAAAKGLSRIALSYGIRMESCAEEMDLSAYGIGHSSCIDKALIGQITGREFDAPKDRFQRPACGCAASVDIGTYNTCPGGCRYCYANYNAGLTRKNMEQYNTAAPILCG